MFLRLLKGDLGDLSGEVKSKVLVGVRGNRFEVYRCFLKIGVVFRTDLIQFGSNLSMAILVLKVLALSCKQARIRVVRSENPPTIKFEKGKIAKNR